VYSLDPAVIFIISNQEELFQRKYTVRVMLGWRVGAGVKNGVFYRFWMNGRHDITENLYGVRQISSLLTSPHTGFYEVC